MGWMFGHVTDCDAAFGFLTAAKSALYFAFHGVKRVGIKYRLISDTVFISVQL